MVKEDKMRKVFYGFVLFLALTFFSQGDFLFSQTPPKGKESEFYYFNYTIEKIYSHRLGFVVVYRRASNIISRTYIPLEWFNTIGGKGEMVYLGSGSEWPSMIVYHKNGEFSHVRLRIRRSRSHETWGVVPFSMNIDEYFQDIEEVKLDY
jgi:hypothetical protein